MLRRLRSIIWMALLLVGCARKPDDINLTNAASHVPRADAAVDIDTWLARREAHFTDITPGAEKTILRVSPDKTPISLVYLHGFSATRQEVSPLIERLSEELGANAYFGRLRGHGRGGDAMLDGSVEAWMEDTAEAMEIGRLLGERVVFVGASTGGTLSAWLASRNPADLAAVVYISPNFELRDKKSRILAWPGRRLLTRIAVGTHREWNPTSDAVARYWTYRYPAPALFPMRELVNHVQRIDFSQLRQPAMVIYSSQDTIIDPATAVARFTEMGATPKKLHEVKDDGDTQTHHVIAGAICSPETTEPLVTEISAFLTDALAL